MTTTGFTQHDGLYIDSQLHMFITEQLDTTTRLNINDIYQTLATLNDEFGCCCRKNKCQQSDVLALETILLAYQQQAHPLCHVDAQTTEAVLDEYCCQIPAIIVVALLDTLSGTYSDEPNAEAIYQRAARLMKLPCVYKNKPKASAA